jgi:hypothetical protein
MKDPFCSQKPLPDAFTFFNYLNYTITFSGIKETLPVTLLLTIDEGEKLSILYQRLKQITRDKDRGSSFEDPFLKKMENEAKKKSEFGFQGAPKMHKLTLSTPSTSGEVREIQSLTLRISSKND